MLKIRFFTGNGPRIYELEGVIRNCKQQGDSVIDYFSKLSKMWDEIANYKKALDCYCRGLTCKWIIDYECEHEEKGYTNSYLFYIPLFVQLLARF